MPVYLAFCVYVCNGEHEENYEKGCVNPGHLLLITLQVSLRDTLQHKCYRVDDDDDKKGNDDYDDDK